MESRKLQKKTQIKLYDKIFELDYLLLLSGLFCAIILIFELSVPDKIEQEVHCQKEKHYLILCWKAEWMGLKGNQESESKAQAK